MAVVLAVVGMVAPAHAATPDPGHLLIALKNNGFGSALDLAGDIMEARERGMADADGVSTAGGGLLGGLIFGQICIRSAPCLRLAVVRWLCREVRR